MAPAQPAPAAAPPVVVVTGDGPGIRRVDVSGSIVRSEFRGKGGIRPQVAIHDRRLARIVRRSRDLPGYELFQYLDEEGNRGAIDSADVNDYLKAAAGKKFTAKDFRTSAGTVLAARMLQELDAFDLQAQVQRNIVRAIEAVAGRLDNTKAVCRKCYVHPAVLDPHLDGTLLQTLRQRAEQELAESLEGLSAEEAAVPALLQERLKRETEQQPSNDGHRKGRRKAF